MRKVRSKKKVRNDFRERDILKLESLGVELPRDVLRPGQVIINVVSVNNSTIMTETPKRRRRAKAKMPGGVFTSFIEAAMKEARVEKFEDGSYYAEIPSCPGVWANGDTEEECLATLQEVLEEWLLFKLRDGDKDIPNIQMSTARRSV
jgi:predicted RNase H-like HicB family nuclease